MVGDWLMVPEYLVPEEFPAQSVSVFH